MRERPRRRDAPSRREIFRAITRDVLDPAVAAEALDLALRDLEQHVAGAGRIHTPRAELTRLEGELSRNAEAIADAGPLGHSPTILEAIKVRKQRRDAIRTALKTTDTLGRSKMRETSISGPSWWSICRTGGMARHVAEARRLLGAVLVGRFDFTPVPRPPDLPTEDRSWPRTRGSQ